MSDPAEFRSAVRRALQEGGLGEERATSSVERIQLEVRVGDRTETVILAMREGRLTVTSTSPEPDAKSFSNPHVRAALEFLAGTPEGSTKARGAPSAVVGEDAVAPPPTGASSLAFASDLDDVVLAVVRAGIDRRDAPYVQDAISRVGRTLVPMPIPLGRWVARLSRALERKDTLLVARLLEGAARTAEAIRAGKTCSEWTAERLIEAVERVTDRTMIELGREPLEARERSSALRDEGSRSAIERRYLLDLATGEILCEERWRNEDAPSLGPCPRTVHVGYAEIRPGPLPRRVRLLQYTIELGASSESLARVQSLATMSFAEARNAARDALLDQPALSEPVALIALSVRSEEPNAPRAQLPLDREERPAGSALFEDALERGEVEWVLGRMRAENGPLVLVPCSWSAHGQITRAI